MRKKSELSQPLNKRRLHLKRPQPEATTIVANHSNNNIADIQADLLAVQTLSNAKAQEAAAFQKEVSATLREKGSHSN